MSRKNYRLFAFLLLFSCTVPKEKGAQESVEVDTIQRAEKVDSAESNIIEDTASWDDYEVEKLSVQGYYPQLANKQKLLFSSNNYKGLWKYSLTNKTTDQISDEAGAGYNYEIIGDTVIYQVKSRNKRIEFASISSQNMIKKVSSNADPQRFVQQQFSSMFPYVYIAPDMQSIHIVLKEKRYQVAPNGVKNYLNASLSPDGTKLLYEVSGGEAHIADLDGNIQTSLGEVDAPKWVSKKEVLYIKRQDDGMQTISSQLYIYNLRTKNAFLVTDLKNIESSSSNASGDMIVANTSAGEIYLFHKNK